MTTIAKPFLGNSPESIASATCIQLSLTLCLWLVQIQLLSDRNIHGSREVHAVNNEFDTIDDDDDDNGAIVPYMMVL